jgi:hypothetical protein
MMFFFAKMLIRINSAAKGIEASCHAARKSPIDQRADLPKRNQPIGTLLHWHIGTLLEYFKINLD